MLIRPTATTGRAILSIRNPCRHVYQSVTPQNQVQPGQDGVEISHLDNLPGSDPPPTDPSEVAAVRGSRTKGTFRGVKLGRARQGTIEVLRPSNTVSMNLLIS